MPKNYPKVSQRNKKYLGFVVDASMYGSHVRTVMLGSHERTLMYGISCWARMYGLL